jgi:hypothetical protein
VTRKPHEESAGDLDPRAAGARRLAGKVCVVTGAGQVLAAQRRGAWARKADGSWWPTASRPQPRAW